MSAVIERFIDPRERPVGNGRVRRLLPHRIRRMVGPFIFADLIGPDVLAPASGIDVDAHPHIGLSTLTYLFDGRIVHRDSTGAVQVIEPGAVNWMTAGSGISHTERSHPDDLERTRTVHGLQTWVALPADAEEVEPSFEHAAAASIPTESFGASSVRIAAGSGWGLDSPVTGSSPLVLAEARLVEGAPVPVESDYRELAVIAVAGDVRIDDQQVAPSRLAVLAGGDRAELAGTGSAVVLGGEPVGRRHIWWNFVHSDPDRIEAAKADWAAQRFPVVPDDHEPFVPLPS